MKNHLSTHELHSRKRTVNLLIGATLCLLALVWLAGRATVSQADSTTDWYVDTETGSDGNDCQTLGTACETVGEAVGRATAGDTIQVAAGVYTENLELQSLTLIGAGPGSTVLDGGQADRVLQTLLEVHIEGVTVQNGKLTGNPAQVFPTSGAGISNYGTLTLEDVRVISNTAVGGGAGIFNNGALVLRDAEIRGNTAEGAGGGIYNWGFATIVSATNTLVAGNSANQGGGVYSFAPLSLKDTTVYGNEAGLTGGGLMMFGATADLVNVTVLENTANRYGAGVLNNAGVLTLTNSTVSKNTAESYSGLANISPAAQTTVLNSTIVNNRRSSSVGNSAGGVANVSDAIIRFKNTIVAGNDTRNCTVNGNWTSEGHNLSSDGTCEFDEPDDKQYVDPQLGPLATYGGQTLTYALLVGSPAIDAGDDVGCPATDQRGVTRPEDGDNDGSARCDIGAFEARNQLSIDDVMVSEGDSGSIDALFTVTLSPTSTQTVTVSYGTADGSASSGSDYDPASGVLVFSPGQAAQPISVSVNGDTQDEPDETFSVNLGSAPGADLIDAQGIVTILDDDGLSSLVIADQSVTEGDNGTNEVVFPVTLSPASAQTVTVDYATADDTANSGSDYAQLAGELAFSPGQTTNTITITVNGDDIDEGESEAFSVVLSNASQATIAKDVAQGTILDDDSTSITIGAGPRVLEGDLGESPAVFEVELTTPAAFVVTVDYYTSDGIGVGGAMAGEDYIAAGGTLTFMPGETTRPITVPVKGDVIEEPDEVFFLRLLNPDPVSLQIQSSSGQVLNDDGWDGDSMFVFLPAIFRGR